MDLTGTWRAAVAEEPLRRAYPDPDFDDSGWEALAVPSHWRSTPAFSATDGPLLLRRQFEHPRPDQASRTWLTFDGVFYQTDVWLDGAYVGDTEGYFAPHSFDITDALRERAEHTLAVEVTCAPQRDRKHKRNLTGVFQHWDCFDPDWNPGGIWRPVHVTTTGTIAFTRLRATCVEATAERALLAFDAGVNTPEAAEVRIVTHVGATDHEEQQRLAAGDNHVEWIVAIDQPRLWWPHALGEPALVDVEVTIHGDTGPSDRRALRTGIRQVRMDDWIVAINGERLFLKGANQGPTRMQLAEATPDDFERDVALARDAGLDFLRVHAHISRPELYDAADRAGLLLWQDLPLQWGYARSIRKQAVHQARSAVDLLGHHPSIALWCAHNEPFNAEVDPARDIESAKLTRSRVLASVVPTYNKTVLDGSLHRALHKADRSRPVIAHSGVFGRTDAHLYFGWYHGHERDLPRVAAMFPRAVRFVSEFGAQAVPATDAFLEPDRWPHLDWELLGRRHALQRAFMDRNGLDPSGFREFKSWRDATQRHQATVIKHHVETLRRLKYRPTGGFAQFSFADGWPGITWSVLDHDRVPKAGFEALREACRPVIVVADRPDALYRPGDPITLDVHVVSDLRTELRDAVVTARLTWDGGAREWRWQGDTPADGVVRVGTIEAAAPSAAGTIELTLSLVTGGSEVVATNAYAADVAGATDTSGHSDTPDDRIRP